PSWRPRQGPSPTSGRWRTTPCSDPAPGPGGREQDGGAEASTPTEGRLTSGEKAPPARAAPPGTPPLYAPPSRSLLRRTLDSAGTVGARSPSGRDPLARARLRMIAARGRRTGQPNTSRQESIRSKTPA